MGSNGEKGARSLVKKVEDQWQRSMEHAHNYPYVWASYGVVWGGLSIYTIYTWRKLRRMEDRVRAIQHKIKQIAEAEEAAKFQEAALKKQRKSAVNSKGSGSEQTGK